MVIVFCRVHKIDGDEDCPRCPEEREETAYYLSVCCQAEPVAETLELPDMFRQYIDSNGAIGRCSKCGDNGEFDKHYEDGE